MHSIVYMKHESANEVFIYVKHIWYTQSFE